MSELGLFGFKNLTKNTIGKNALTLRFREPVTNTHNAQVMEAIYMWMLFRKMVMEGGGAAITPERAAEFLNSLVKQAARADDAQPADGGVH